MDYRSLQDGMGQTSGNFPYSVAEHSLLVEQIFSKSFKKSEKKWCLAALLHDAPEYVIGDMISPVKSTIGIGYQSLENRLTSAINLRFGLPTKIPDNVKKQIKKADKISAWIEAIQIAGFTKDEANKFVGIVDNKNMEQFSIKLRPPLEVRENYILRFNELII
jgi:5'-deoxynucleotidase YfbR-like HD superfamily hydrolase